MGWRSVRGVTAHGSQSRRSPATKRDLKSVCNPRQVAVRQVLAPVVVVACRREFIPCQNNHHAAAQCPPASSAACHHTFSPHAAVLGTCPCLWLRPWCSAAGPSTFGSCGVSNGLVLSSVQRVFDRYALHAWQVLVDTSRSSEDGEYVVWGCMERAGYHGHGHGLGQVDAFFTLTWPGLRQE